MRTKFVAALQALRLEQVWSKQQILAAYLNRLDYGNFNQGCAGAAEFYFAKPMRDLSVAECAFLAGLPQAPSRFNPHTHFERAAKREQWVLGQMRGAGSITEEQYLRAAAEPLHLAPPRRAFAAPHFVDLVLSTAVERAGRTTATDAPGQVHTTLDLALNRFAEDTLRRHLVSLKSQHVSNGAVVVLDSKGGDVLALVGSEDYFEPGAGQVNGAWAARSTGSALKPFTYLLALEHGATPATVVADVPSEFATATGLFVPVNYDRRCRGPIRYRVALANSLNISAVKVLASIGGAQPLQEFLQQCGSTTLRRSADDYGLGLTLGNGEMRLLELANAYACLARLGVYKPYRLLGATAFPACSPSRRVADPAAAFLIADILSDNDARALAFGLESPLRFNFPVACKTGTSTDFRDNWAFGYTPEFTVGVWVGNFDGAPMRHISGVTGAGPIFHEIFERLRQRYGTTWYTAPSNIVECWVHPITGKRFLSENPGPAPAVREKFIASNLPPLGSPGDYLPTSAGRSGTVRLSSEYRDWAASCDNSLGDSVAPGAGSESVRILFPPAGTTFYLDPDLPQQGRRIRLRAAGAEPVEWQSDSLQLSLEDGFTIALLSEGRHCLSARDRKSGAVARTWFEVRAR